MSEHGEALPLLPLALWRTPPGLELALKQEGVPHEAIRSPHPLALQGARFVLFDSRSARESRLRALLAPGQVAIDVHPLRAGEPVDPFEALVDTRACDCQWSLEGFRLAERIARQPKAAIRRRLIDRLRQSIWAAGGVWLRLAPFPDPYRSAFCLRADLDEPQPDDYHRFAHARTPLDQATTHFLSTHAYAHHAHVIADLRQLDTQSHGHFHHVYPDLETNRLNLERAHKIMQGAGFDPVGFAAPHGRWNPGLDQALEDLGYLYSSEFQLGYDDFPFFPWKRDRFSRVLQIPIHPVCEGLFLEAGVDDPDQVAGYFDRVVRERTAAGELVVIYGHPERRLGRMPGVVSRVARAAAASALTWRTTMTELARWWRYRGELRFLVVERSPGTIEIQFDRWDERYRLAIEVERGGFRCTLPIHGPCTRLELACIAYERRPATSPDLPEPVPAARPFSLRRALRGALDWETCTPIEELPRLSLKRSLRRFQSWRARSTA